MKDIFDVYDIRARLSVVIFLVSPVLFSLYLQVESIRNLASTTVIAVIVMALSNLLMVLIREKGKQIYHKREIMVQYLFLGDTHIDRGIKERLYSFLGTVDEKFCILSEKKEEEPISEEYRNACKSALNWLKEHTRDSNIVNRENAVYGFCRNLLGAKKIGILICATLLAIQAALFILEFHCTLSCLTEEYLLSFFVAVLYLLLWIFPVRLKIVEVSAKYYTEALLVSFDKFIEAKKEKP